MNAGKSNFSEKFLRDHADGGLLSSLKPLAWENAKNIVERFDGISLKYIDFISRIGVGETRNGLYVYEPYCVSELSNDPSFQIYNSTAARRLFRLLPAKISIPRKLVCVADSGASWRYCLDLSNGDEVVCFDMCGAKITKESNDFISFIDEQVFGMESQ